MDTIAIFNNRQDALTLASFLKKNNVACSVINTPKTYVKHCALSVIFNHNFVKMIKSNFSNVLISNY